MKKNFMLSAFSLMEMMIVLLIVAIIAAASAPMISKKMMRQTGTGDSPWLFTGTGNNIVFNGNGNLNNTVFIGASGLANPNNWNDNDNYVSNTVARITGSPLIIASTINQVNQNASAPCLTFADDQNRIMGHLGMTRGTVYFSNAVPDDDLLNDDSSIVIGTNINAFGVRHTNNGNNHVNGNYINNKIIIGDTISYDCVQDDPWRNHDIIFGTHIGNTGMIRAESHRNNLDANILIGTNIQNPGGGTINSTAAIGSNINLRDGNITNGIVVGDSAELHAGDGSIAFGSRSVAQGDQALAVGNRAQAWASNTVAIGNHAIADMAEVIAIGNNAHNRNNADHSISIGSNAASGDNAITIGSHTGVNPGLSGARGNSSIAIGLNATANNDNAIAIGSGASATGQNSVAIGDGVVASDNEIVLGRNNLPNNQVHTVVIPGTLDITGTVSNRTLIAMRNALGIPSDIRLKNVGEKFTSGLEDIKKLEFFNYTYKNDKKQKPHVGVMAQDLQKVFPISVTEGSDGYLTIRLDEMFYSALNAIKELDNKISELKNKVVAYFNRIEKLEAQIDEQQKTIEELKAQNAEFKKRLAKIEKKRGLNKGGNKGGNSTATMGTNPKLSESEAE